MIPASIPALATLTALASMVAISTPALATEGGGSVYPNGVETFMAGAVPPPGLYGLVYSTNYSADKLIDNNGNNLNVPGFKVRATVVAPRLVWVPGKKVLNGDLVFSAIAPLVDLKVRAAGASDSRRGLGDVTLGAGVAWHHSPNLHSVAAIDVFTPTGSYDKNRLANTGRNYLAVEPLYAISYIDPQGLNADIKLGYIMNRRNSDTNYKSGDEFHFDYALGWGLGGGWTAGVGGYLYQQVTNDNNGGADVAGNKGRAFAIGPAVKYDSGKGWLLMAKWQKESGVRNRAEGSAFWLKAVFPF